MEILKSLKKIPGGLLIVPMIITSIINTFYPIIFNVGGITPSILTKEGTMTLIIILLFISGTQFKISQVKPMLKIGGTLILFKLFLVYLISMFFVNVFGMQSILGISILSITSVFISNNPGLYLALNDSFGDEIDASVFGLLNLIIVPSIPVMILSSVNGQSIDFISLFRTISPFILGVIFGNLDKNIRFTYQSATNLLLPFLGISFGGSINILNAINSGLTGVILTLSFYILITLPMFIFEKKILKRTGFISIASSSVAGTSLAAPVLAAQINTSYESFVSASISQIALVMIITTIITPVLTKKLISKKAL